MEEIWKDVEGFEGLYRISNFGNILSLDRTIYRSNGIVQHRKRRIMSKRINQDGYYIAKFTVNNHSKSIPVHRLVARAFVPNPYNLPEVNHIDMDRTNNRSDNLEWCTHDQNIKHSAKAGHYTHYGSENQNYGKRTLHKKYAENPELSKEKQSRPREQNGRSRKVSICDSELNPIMTFDWIGGCAEYLIKNGLVRSKHINSIRFEITKSIKNNTSYSGLFFKFAE